MAFLPFTTSATVAENSYRWVSSTDQFEVLCDARHETRDCWNEARSSVSSENFIVSNRMPSWTRGSVTVIFER